MWYQQDGAHAHTSNVAIRYLQGQFPGKLISRCGDFPLPPRSPDLAILDFFLWGYLKHKIWDVPVAQQPQTVRELKAAIESEWANLPAAMTERSFDGMVERCHKCIRARGLSCEYGTK